MAAAVPLTDSSTVSRRRATLRVIATGPFGNRVAGHLLDTYARGLAGGPADLESAFASPCDAVVLALWRPAPGLCERAEELARSRKAAWLPITMDHRMCRVGPLVCGRSPCFRCYRRRCEQHDVQPAITAALLGAYARDPALGPGGYLPHHARMAAAMAFQMLRCLPTGQDPGGQVLVPGSVATIRLRGEGITVSRVVPCHDCDRCGGPPGPRADLARVLAELRPGLADPDDGMLARAAGRTA
jgi:bacteriocin biosynthesis cyclodehydratase domain-containing protein